MNATFHRRAGAPVSLALALALAGALSACKGKDVALTPTGGENEAGTGETIGDGGLGGASANDGGPVDAGPYVPDAVPFDALPVSEPEAPSAPLLAEIRDFPGRFAMYARNLVTGGAVMHGSDEWLLAGPFMRLWPVALYLEKVARGEIDPETELVFTEAFYRGGDKDLTPELFDKSFKLSRLATLALLSANASAEEMLVSALGGSGPVNDFIESFSLEGMGKYLAPCEADRAHLRRLDPRFDDVACTPLSIFARDDDARGLVPAPFDTPPVFTDEAVAAAHTAAMDAHENAATAKGIGEVLARVHGRALPSAAGSVLVRDLLDHALGSGGGGNNLPDRVWVGNVQGSVFAGRIWAALIRGGEAPVALVLMSDRETNAGAVGARFDRAGLLAWEQLVGPVDLRPPAEAVPHPAWLGGIFIHEPEESRHCNLDFSGDYEALLSCRHETQRVQFRVDESTAGTVMVKDGPDVEATWLWTEPDGARHRYQVKIGEGGWWAWTRSFTAVAPGDWRLDVWLNGEPHLLGRFPVLE